MGGVASMFSDDMTNSSGGRGGSLSYGHPTPATSRRDNSKGRGRCGSRSRTRVEEEVGEGVEVGVGSLAIFCLSCSDPQSCIPWFAT